MPLLSTKLYIPPARPDAISRPHLTGKLLAGLHQEGSFVLLSGPAGFGKTTLLSETLAQFGGAVAWLSLDGEDNDPTRFWTYFIAACRSVHKAVGEGTLTLLRAPQTLPVEALPGTLINDIDELDSDLVLVLDDYYEIQNESIHVALSYLLEHLPRRLHLAVSTRVDPPWRLARFRARNQLVEVRAQDLRFTADETAAFLSSVMGLELSAADIAALEERTEGWAAGLQLAALSMKGREDIPAFIQAFTGSHIYVAEYLLEEVLKQQPEDFQTFMLQTSLLERMTASLCESITGCKDGQAMLGALQRANLFLTPLDDEGRWFRYHQLFADLLQARLRQETAAAEIGALHARAASWYEQNGFTSEAVNHALAAGDFEDAARLIEGSSGGMLVRGQLTTLMQWIESLPEQVERRHPLLIVAKAWTLALAGAAPQVEQLLAQVEAQGIEREQTQIDQELAGNLAAIRAFFSMMAGDYPRAQELAGRAEALLPESSVHARWLLPYILGMGYRAQEQYEEAVQAYERLAQMGERYDNLLIWATGVTEVALVRRLQGRLHQAAETCYQALQRMAERGATRFGSLAKVEVPLIEVLREQNHLEEAYRRATDVVERMHGWPMPTDRIFAYLALLHVQRARGDLDEAFKTLQLTKELKANHPILVNLKRSVDHAEVRLSLEAGDIAAAERQLDEIRASTGGPALDDGEQALLARLHLARGRWEEAKKILVSFELKAQAGGRRGALIEALILHARLYNDMGERESALDVLSKALALGEPEGFVRSFIDEGEAMWKLLEAVMRHIDSSLAQVLVPSRAYVSRLLETFPEATTTGKPLPSSREADLVEHLTPREMEVLQLIADGDSNRTIADKLVITVSAVKKHTANIYGKLGVNSRTQAAARARQLGLLPPD